MPTFLEEETVKTIWPWGLVPGHFLYNIVYLFMAERLHKKF